MRMLYDGDNIYDEHHQSEMQQDVSFPSYYDPSSSSSLRTYDPYDPTNNTSCTTVAAVLNEQMHNCQVEWIFILFQFCFEC